jgi:heme-degrading monooxygenase HmoA
MIARVWRGWARPELADQYEVHYRSEVLEHLQGVAGFVGARLLRRQAGDEVEFVSLTFFDDLDAVRGFAGSAYETAVVAAPARKVLSRFEETVAHYETSFATSGAEAP